MDVGFSIFPSLQVHSYLSLSWLHPTLTPNPASWLAHLQNCLCGLSLTAGDSLSQGIWPPPSVIQRRSCLKMTPRIHHGPVPWGPCCCRVTGKVVGAAGAKGCETSFIHSLKG